MTHSQKQNIFWTLALAFTYATSFTLAPQAVAGEDCCNSSKADCCSQTKPARGKHRSDKQKKGKDMSDKKDKNTSAISTVSFTQSGGFAGINRGSEIIFADLSAADQQKLQKLIEDSGLLNDKDIKKLNQSARDVFIYGFKANAGGVMHQAQYDDTTLPDEYRPLLEFLQHNQQTNNNN